MATITKKNARNLPDPSVGGSPAGTMAALSFKFTTNASGVMTDSDQTTAVASGDIVRLGVLPRGMRLIDCLAVVSDAFTASSTGMLGFAYVDGVDSSAVPQDNDFFFAATTIAATGVIRKTAVTPPVTLPKDAYLILTNGGAAQAAAGVMDIDIICDVVGAS